MYKHSWRKQWRDRFEHFWWNEHSAVYDCGNTLASIATVNNGVFITSSGGVPSASTSLSSTVQGNITTVGTIGTGTWNATDIALGAGGTNASLTAVNGGIVYSNASAMAISAAGSSGQILQSAGAAAPVWSTATYPARLEQPGKFLRQMVRILWRQLRLFRRSATSRSIRCRMARTGRLRPRHIRRPWVNRR